MLSLKEARKSIQKTQKEVAQELGISQSSLSKIETNENTFAVLKKYLRYLKARGVDLNKIF